MFQKRFLIFLLVAVVSSLSSVTAFGQGAPVSGIVKLQKDGASTPVAGAIVEAFRTDIERGKMPEAKTNKRGEFTFVSFQFGQRYVLSVSGPGISPQVYPEVKAGMDKIEIIVNEGDGRKLTEVEARQAAKTAIPSATGEMSEAEKKERAELEKKNAEIMASNKKAENTNKVVTEALKAGADAFKAENYDLAITEFDRGIQADPEFVGSAPVFLNYKGLAHQKRALAAFNAAARGDGAAKVAAQEKIKADLASAFAAFNRGMELIQKGTAGVAAADLKNVATTRMQILANTLDSHGYAARISPDPSRDALAAGVLEQYIAAETDVTKRNPVLLVFASNMNGAGELKTASAAYRKVLADTPDNLDALVGLGLALYSEGSMTSPPNKEILQEGLNYMQRFVDTAPDTHKLKESTKTIIDELKNEQKLAPQKSAPRKRG